jgi:hypothetical protein
MNTPSKLGADSLGLVAVFASTLGIGATVAPVGPAAATQGTASHDTGPAASTNPATPQSAAAAQPRR